MIARVVPSSIPSVWPFVSPLLNHKKILNNFITINDLYQKVVNNKADLWVPIDEINAAMIGFILPNQHSKTYVIKYAGGNVIRLFPDVLNVLEIFCKNFGCSEIEIRGRKGWIKKLPKFELQQITMVKKI